MGSYLPVRSKLQVLIESTENFHSEILSWSLDFDLSKDGSEKTSFFLRHYDPDFDKKELSQTRSREVPGFLLGAARCGLFWRDVN